jgi:hypothetical protein
MQPTHAGWPTAKAVKGQLCTFGSPDAADRYTLLPLRWGDHCAQRTLRVSSIFEPLDVGSEDQASLPYAFRMLVKFSDLKNTPITRKR